MKIRTDSATNSSSANHVIEFQLKNDRDAVAYFQIRNQEYGVSGSNEAFISFEEPVEALQLYSPIGNEGEILFFRSSLSQVKSLEELIKGMLSLARMKLCGGRHLWAIDIMPGAVEALSDRCRGLEITLDNLRIIGGKIEVSPLGDSSCEVERYIDQWGANVEEGELRHTGAVTWQGWDTPNWNPGWLDTAWWPLDGLEHERKKASSASGTWRRPTTQTRDMRDMSNLFYDRTDLTEIDLSKLDTSSVVNMRGMFCWCQSLKSIDLSHLDTSQVRDMSNMFHACKSIENLDLSHFDTSRVTDMHDMFSFCESLEGLDLSGLDTSQVTNMRWMFRGCKSLRSLDLSGFDTSRVRDMSEMFQGCGSLERIDLSGFDISRATTMRGMLSGCRQLTSVGLPRCDTSQVTDMQELFDGCGNLKSIDLSVLDLSQVTNMASMFGGCWSLESISFSGLDTSQVRDMGYLFYGCSSLVSLELSGIDTSQVTSMTHMFYNCTALRSFDFSGIDASRVHTTKNMFRRCRSLERWSIPASWPLHLRGAIPNPTAENGMWWSMRDAMWLTIGDIRARGPMADTFTSFEPKE